MYEFWYDYIKPKYEEKARLCYMDTDSFVIHIKTEDFYKDTADDVDKWFDTSKYKKDDNRPLPIGINEGVLGKLKDELKGKIMTEFIALRAKTYAYLLDDDSEHKKAKGTKKCIIKRELTFKNYKDSLLNNEIVIKSQHRFRSDHHKVYTEEVNKIALSSNDDKRIQTFDRITTYPYGTNAFKVCENEMRYAILKNKSQTLRSESQILRNESQILRNESQALRSESQTIRSKSLKCKNELKALRNESQTLRNESQTLRNESQALRSESQILRNESKTLRSESKILRNKSQTLRSDHRSVYTEEVNKIALSSNDDKRLQKFDKVTTFPYRTPVVKVCQSQMKMEMQNDIYESEIDNVDVQNDIYESEIDNVDDADNVDMHNETCESKIDNVDALEKINNKTDAINKINKRLAKIKIRNRKEG